MQLAVRACRSGVIRCCDAKHSSKPATRSPNRPPGDAAYAVAPQRPKQHAAASSHERVSKADQPIYPKQQPQQQGLDPLQWLQQPAPEPPKQSLGPGPASGHQPYADNSKQHLQRHAQTSSRDFGKAVKGAGMSRGLLVVPSSAQPVLTSNPEMQPPLAPEDPAELLQVLQRMQHPRRRLVIFKGGGYVYADLENMIQEAGLGHVIRLTNLIRKGHCIVAKARRDNGKRVNLQEHIAAARNANIPFLLIEKLDPVQLVQLLRPVLVQKRIVVEPRPRPGRGGSVNQVEG